MDKKELNADIKKLGKKIVFLQTRPNLDKFWEFTDSGEFRKEFRRLYDLDKKFEYMSMKSLKILMVLNRKYQVVPFHAFGIQTNLDELL